MSRPKRNCHSLIRVGDLWFNGHEWCEFDVAISRRRTAANYQYFATLKQARKAARQLAARGMSGILINGGRRPRRIWSFSPCGKETK